jgi:hypothetical protein
MSRTEAKSAGSSRLNAALRSFAGWNGETGMVDYHGRFAWYELMTTDVTAATAFYANVIGWGAQDASTPDLAYTLLTAGTASVAGLMELPGRQENGRDAPVDGICRRQRR